MTPQPGEEVVVAELPGAGITVAGSGQFVRTPVGNVTVPFWRGLGNGVRIRALSFLQLAFVEGVQ